MSFSDASVMLFIPVILVLVVMHELIHGLMFGTFAKDHFQSVEFGVIWSALTPYCTCTQPMKKWQYLLSGAMPTLILGLGLAAVATVIQSFFLLALSEIMIFSGGGDFLIMLKVLCHRSKGTKAVYYDHPYDVGFVVFEK